MKKNDEAEEPTELERMKADSDGLREPLATELAAETPDFTEAGRQILKFHGIYQQDDRDVRSERRKAGLDRAWQMMVRSKIPGGVLTADQYLAHDDLAERFGDGTLRITTRQGIQLHGVVKRDLKATVRRLNDALVTTLGACGDVERNVLACPAPYPDRARSEALTIVQELSRRTLPSGGAYHDIWLDGVRVTERPRTVDRLYGERYLPRKFKTALAFEDDNCTDVLSNDLGFLGTRSTGRLEGFEVLVGGGLGMTHNKPSTFPRLADPLGWIPPERAVEVAEAVISVQRDHGNRSNRRIARLKYLVHERGLEWFRDRVEEHLASPLDPPRGVRVRDVLDHVGWHAQGDGAWYFGIHVENGRVKDAGSRRLRSGIRRLVERYRPGVRLTAHQNLLLTDIRDADREAFTREVEAHGLGLDGLTTVRRWSMACPALPTCGLALTESERVMPGVLDELEREIRALGLSREHFTVRMTGCPNGCARPYTAEIGFVGRSRDRYKIFVGGSVRGDHLGFELADLVHRDELVATVRPLLERFVERDDTEEGLGEFVRRVGRDTVRSWTGTES